MSQEYKEKIKKLNIELAIEDAKFWANWLREQTKDLEKKILNKDTAINRYAVEAGAKSSLLNTAIETIEDLEKRLKNIETL